MVMVMIVSLFKGFIIMSKTQIDRQECLGIGESNQLLVIFIGIAGVSVPHARHYTTQDTNVS